MTVIIFTGNAILAVRLIWEQTALSWAQGPQMVGFSLAHSSGLLLFIFPLMLAVWLLAVAISVAWTATRRGGVTTEIGIWCLSGFILLGLLSTPYAAWQRLFIARIVSGPFVAEFFDNAAATKQLFLVKAMRDRGVPVDITNREGKTALHGAAVEGDLRMIEYLLAQGADVNQIDLWGNSPVEDAIEMGHTEAANLLGMHGGKKIKGSPQQQKDLVDRIVREDLGHLPR